MPAFDIEIKEELSRVVTINANSLRDALHITQDKYKNNQIILDENDFKGYEILPYNN